MKPIIHDELHILIIDDDELFSGTLQLLLEEILVKKCSIKTTNNASSSLSILENRDYDFIFLDYKLPDADGLSVLQEFKKRKIDTPVIFMTGFNEETLTETAIKLGAVDYLSKGNMDIERLVKGINEVIIDSYGIIKMSEEISARA